MTIATSRKRAIAALLLLAVVGAVAWALGGSDLMPGPGGPGDDRGSIELGISVLPPGPGTPTGPGTTGTDGADDASGDVAGAIPGPPTSPVGSTNDGSGLDGPALSPGGASGDGPGPDVLGSIIARPSPVGPNVSVPTSSRGAGAGNPSGPGQGSGPGNGAGQGNGGPGQGSGPGNGAGQGAGAGQETKTFAVGGSVAGLYPGAALVLQLAVHNPHTFAVDLLAISTTPGPANAAGCPDGLLRVDAWEGRSTIERGATVTVEVLVRLHHDTPDACQGASWPLTFTGTAEKAQR